MSNNISAIEDNRPSGRHAQQHEPPQYPVPLSVETHTLNRSSTSPAGTRQLAPLHSPPVERPTTAFSLGLTQPPTYESAMVLKDSCSSRFVRTQDNT